MELPVFFCIRKVKQMANWHPGQTQENPKMILLTQLKRYDEKIKQKIENSSGGYITDINEDPSGGIFLDVTDSTLSASLNTDDLPGFVAVATQSVAITESGVIQLNAQSEYVSTGFKIDPKGGISATTEQTSDFYYLTFKLNVGHGVKLNETTGALEANVDETTIGINGNTGMIGVRPTESITVTNQSSSGSVSAHCSLGTVCVIFADILVAGHAKTKVGQIAKAYAPSVKTTGTLAGVGANDVLTAYCQVDTDGSIYINPVKTSGADAAWTGTLTYLI